MSVKVVINTSKMELHRHERCQQIAKEMELIFNSSLFKEKFLAMKPVGELSEWRNEERLPELYNYIMSGANILDPVKDGVIEIELDDYYKRFGSAVGYTYPNTRTIFVNTKYFDSFNNKYAGSNIAHELCHKCGAEHDFKSTARRPYSVPYLVNNIYEQCHDILIGNKNEELPEWVQVCYRPWYRFGFKKCVWIKNKLN